MIALHWITLGVLTDFVLRALDRGYRGAMMRRMREERTIVGKIAVYIYVCCIWPHLIYTAVKINRVK